MRIFTATRRASILLLSGMLLSGLLLAQPSAATATGGPEAPDWPIVADKGDPGQLTTPAPAVAPDRVVVRWRAGLDDARGDALLRSRGLKELPATAIERTALVATGGRSVDSVLAELRGSPDVEWAEPDYLVQLADDGLAAVPLPAASVLAAPAVKSVNDPLTGDQYSLDRMHVREAWTVTTGGSDIVAVLDTGVWAAHPDLGGRLVAGRNLVANPDNNNTADDNGHGTWVAGIIAANANNGVGVAGVTWSNKVMPVKVMNQNGSGYTSDLAAGIRWAVDHGASVINMSIGGYGNGTLLHDAIRYAWDHDVVMVAAAGNSRSTVPSYPAAFPEVISASATQPDDEFTNWSNYGTTIDVSAPGASVLTTNCDKAAVAACPYSGKYIYISGTSFATPNTAGVVALARARYPQKNVGEITALIKSTADDLGYAGKDDRYGNGRVNAMRAVGGSTAAATPSPGDALEPNNTFAASATVSVGTTFRPSIHPAGDTDYFSFNVPRAGRLDLSVTAIVDDRAYPWHKSSLLVDPVLHIYNASGALIKTVDDPGSSATTERASIQMASAGRIVLRVSNWTPNGNRAAYSVSSTFVDNVAPTVTAQQPKPGQDPFAFDASVRVTFDEPVTGVSGSSVVLRDASGAQVPARVTYQASQRRAVLNPKSPLAGRSTYRVSLTSAIRDAAGNALAARSWSFTTGPSVTRLAGADRYATAAAVSQAGFDPGVPVAYVATGANFPDALAAGPLAAKTGGPILLTAGDSLPAATAAELGRLKPNRIVVLGGKGAVGDGVLDALRPYAGSGKVTRLAGADRYATAAAVSQAGFDPGVPVAYVATGLAFADALSAVPLAGVCGCPLLITDPRNLTGATSAEISRLNPATVVLLGGTGALSEAVLGEVRALAY